MKKFKELKTGDKICFILFEETWEETVTQITKVYSSLEIRYGEETFNVIYCNEDDEILFDKDKIICPKENLIYVKEIYETGIRQCKQYIIKHLKNFFNLKI